MRIISTNLGKPTPITWNGEQTTTGIYKYPVNEPIFLNKETVNLDNVSNRSVHGGEFKACYLFSKEQYPYWQAKYPDLEWEWGMFGENLTVEGLDEKTLKIGNIYKVGSALVQVTQPREPCFKLGIRFKDQNILKAFIDHGYPGTYVRVLEIGEVHTGDEFELVEESSSSLTTHEFYNLLYSRKKDSEIVQLALENEALPERKRAKLKRFITN